MTSENVGLLIFKDEVLHRRLKLAQKVGITQSVFTGHVLNINKENVHASVISAYDQAVYVAQNSKGSMVKAKITL